MKRVHQLRWLLPALLACLLALGESFAQPYAPKAKQPGMMLQLFRPPASDENLLTNNFKLWLDRTLPKAMDPAETLSVAQYHSSKTFRVIPGLQVTRKFRPFSPARPVNPGIIEHNQSSFGSNGGEAVNPGITEIGIEHAAGGEGVHPVYTLIVRSDGAFRYLGGTSADGSISWNLALWGWRIPTQKMSHASKTSTPPLSPMEIERPF